MKAGIVNSVLQGVFLLLVTLYPASGFIVHRKSALQKWEDMKKVCGKNCLHGYYTDVEGNPICKCRVPCKSVYCFNGTECVVRNGVASCEPKRESKGLFQRKRNRKQKNEVIDMSNILLQDSGTTSRGVKEQDLCSEPLRDEARKCDIPSRRFYYNAKKGTCVRFKGCETPGNNFAKRRDCKKTCMKGKRNGKKFSYRKVKLFPRTDIARAPSKETSNETNVCNLPLDDANNCDSRLVRRWRFDIRSGICIRVKACKTATGNYFRKRRECKRQCMRTGGRRQGRKRKGKRRSKGRRRESSRING